MNKNSYNNNFLNTITIRNEPHKDVCKAHLLLNLREIFRVAVLGLTLLGLLCYSDVKMYSEKKGMYFLYFQFKLSPELIGVIFLVMAAAYAVSSPIWGWVADKMVGIHSRHEMLK